MTHLRIVAGALALTLLLLSVEAEAQSRHFSNWIFGTNCHFSWDAKNKLTMGKPPASFSTGEGCATYSDPLTGALLLYTDGMSAWNPKGTKISSGHLGGHSSGQYSGLIIPAPGFKGHYYVFANNSGVGAIRYTRFDMTGAGKQVGSTMTVGSSGGTNESMQIIPHSNRRDFWLYTSTTSTVYVASITPKGVSGLTGTSMGGNYSNSYWGPFRVSNSRKLLMHAQGYPYQPSTVSLWDLDPATGKVSNRRSIGSIPTSGNHTYGAEFSPDDTKIYVTRIGASPRIFQLDLSNKNKVTDLGAVPSSYGGAPTLALDGKIYVTQYLRSTVSVINKPNLAGTACNYVASAIKLPSGCTSQLMFPTALATFSKVALDADKDTIADGDDLDSDNDGIPDKTELGGTDMSVDTDADGVPDYVDPNSVSCTDTSPLDGFCDTIPAAYDADGDGVPNHLDLDSDNDGIPDIIEAGGKDTDNDGRVDSFTDANKDGLDDTLASTPLAVPDTDNDKTADLLDLDSDGDKALDLIEAGGADTDKDGKVDAFVDTNGDGRHDALAQKALPLPDSDGDGKANYVDLCADGLVTGSEGCDDSNITAGDGCSSACAVESGWQCSGAPSVCKTTCGDGVIAGAEQCDDKNSTAGDGCSASCQVENGYKCTGAPSTCAPVCGDGVIAGGEQCDDKNSTDGDGCSAKCTSELGWSCTGAPSACKTSCGDGVIAGAEKCDDKNTTSGDGCSATCQPEAGWLCAGLPSVCAPVCGDGLVFGAEQCDDKNTTDGDGCSASCKAELGWICNGTPSVCATTCGDGIVAGAEKCDDKNTTDGDGCSATCTVEKAWSCTGSPSKCTGCTDTTKGGTDVGCAVAKPACNEGVTPGVCVECTDKADCTSGICDTKTFTCSKASCSDGVKNGNETGVDCGGPDCGKCKDSLGCAKHTDCLSGYCDPKTNLCGSPCPKAKDPLDCDGDGLANTKEDKNGNGKVDTGETDPQKKDTDGDGLDDGEEVTAKTDPLKKDTDGDGLDDGEEVTNKTDPLKKDTDGDGIDDGKEVTNKTDPLKKDTDGDGLDDGAEDKNGNGKVDSGETDPLKKDSDGGTVDDATELKNGTDPLDPADDVPAATDDEGCSCAVGSGAGDLPWLALVLLGLLVARRRRR